jgi:hypothetical protein
MIIVAVMRVLMFYIIVKILHEKSLIPHSLLMKRGDYLFQELHIWH